MPRRTRRRRGCRGLRRGPARRSARAGRGRRTRGLHSRGPRCTRGRGRGRRCSGRSEQPPARARAMLPRLWRAAAGCPAWRIGGYKRRRAGARGTTRIWTTAENWTCAAPAKKPDRRRIRHPEVTKKRNELKYMVS
jgi:hypothetical protein